MANVAPCKNLDGYGPTPLEAGDTIDPAQIDLSGVAPLVHNHSAESWFTTPLALKADLVGGVIPTAQIPAQAVSDVFPVASQAAMLALTAQRGDIAIRSDVSKTFILSTDSPATLADWKEMAAPGAVTSVNGQQGIIVLAKADLGLGNVDNTSDANKPVSTATSTALSGKANTTHGHSQSDITNLVSDLAGKAATSHAHAWADITSGKPTTVAGYGITDAAAAPIATLVVPLTGQTRTFNTSKQWEVIACNHAATIAAQTFVFPTDANSQIGQELRIFSNKIITTVTLTLNGNTIIGLALTTLPAGGNVAWRKVGTNLWARIQ